MQAIVFALLAGLCWGLGEFFTKQVLMSGKIGPWAVVMVRVVAVAPLALLLYWLAAAVFKSEPKAWWNAPAPILVRLFVGSALLAGLGGVAFFYLGLKFGDISVVKPIAMGVGPVVGAVLGWYFLREQMPAIKVLGIGLMVLGLVLISLGGRHGRSTSQTHQAAEPSAARDPEATGIRGEPGDGRPSIAR